MLSNTPTTLLQTSLTPIHFSGLGDKTLDTGGMQLAASPSAKYVDWSPLEGGDNSFFRAFDAKNAQRVLAALVPKTSLPARTAVDVQAQLDRLARHPEVPALSVWEVITQPTCYQIFLRDPGYRCLSDIISTCSTSERLEIALQLLWSIHTACLRDIYHGCLTTRSLFIEQAGSQQLRVNFLERFMRSSESIQWSTDQLYSSDLRSVIAIVSGLIEPLHSLDDQKPELSGRKLAALKRLCREEPEDKKLEAHFERWCSALGECVSDQKNPFRAVWLEPLTKSENKNDSDLESSKTQVVDSVPPQAVEPNSGTVELLTREPLLPGQTLGRYKLERILGKGGMGIVFRAIEETTGRIVAIKVLLAVGNDNTHAVRRFRKEARILASVQNEFVTELLEVGEERGYHFLVMEFVDGPNLKQWLGGRVPLPEQQALTLIRDITKALVQAHGQQIVHRDIKPENILLAPSNDVDTSEDLGLSDYHVKLSDFGIARHIEQSVSMEVTRSGTMLGTPWYMSPEQCKGSSEIGPSADVYALGIMLFELLSGELPYVSEDPMQLAAMHCFDPPPDVQKRNRQISERTSLLLTRMMAKQPKDRPADASQLLRELESILIGAPADIEDHPRLPNKNTDKLWSRVFQWDLKSTPNQLWPYVCDTDRLNRAVGLPSVSYRTVADPDRGIRKFGSFKIGGMKVEWEEHPFEWVEGKRMGVLREFSTGPFRWFMSSVEFLPLPSGGTRLVHTVKIEPRNTLGKIVSTIEAGWKGGRALDKVYRRIDDYLQQKQKEEPILDAFESSAKLARESLKRIEERLAQMLDMGVELEVASRLCEFIKTATPQAAAKIRPLELAGTLELDSDQVVDACIVAAHCGLLQLKWDILCPTCKAPATSEPLLSRIASHTECEACASEFQSNLGNAIELVFSVHPEIRGSDSAKYCIGGPAHSPHVVSQVRLQPGERIELQVPMEVGDYLVRTTQSILFQSIRVRADHAPTSLELEVSKLGKLQSVPNARAGIVSLAIANDTDRQQLVRVERTINRNDVVTASAASTLQRFRECFPEQIFDRKVPVDSEELTLVAIQINNAESLYQSLGDAEAYRWFQTFQERVEKSILAWNGAVVKTLDEGLIATFYHASAAAQAASEIAHIRSELDPRGEAILGIGVHRGRTLVSTQNGRLDYFGSAPRTVQQLANAANDAILLSDAAFADSSVNEILKAWPGLRTISTIAIPSNPHQIVQSFHLNSVHGTTCSPS